MSTLVVDGRVVGDRGNDAGTKAGTRPRASASTPKSKRPAQGERWPAPELRSDGSIDEPDPFAGEPVEVLPIPIEDDPETTRALDAWSARLKRVDIDQWNRWMDAGLDSPWVQQEDSVIDTLVKVTVERCGGARTVATGVVLADDTVVTTVHAVENASKRVQVAQALGDGERISAMIRYLDVDDDIAVLKVPGLQMESMLFHVVTDHEPHWGYAYGIGRGGKRGSITRTPVVVAMDEAVADVEQPDGFAEEISDRSFLPALGAFDTGFSGGVVTATNDPSLRTLWGFRGLIRARVPFRSDTGGIVVPARLVGDALNASDRLPEWFEIEPRGCPQWRR